MHHTLTCCAPCGICGSVSVQAHTQATELVAVSPFQCPPARREWPVVQGVMAAQCRKERKEEVRNPPKFGSYVHHTVHPASTRQPSGHFLAQPKQPAVMTQPKRPPSGQSSRHRLWDCTFPYRHFPLPAIPLLTLRPFRTLSALVLHTLRGHSCFLGDIESPRAIPSPCPALASQSCGHTGQDPRPCQCMVRVLTHLGTNAGLTCWAGLLT